MTRPGCAGFEGAPLRRAHVPAFAFVSLAFVALGACVPAPAPLDINHTPVARLVVPQLWPASQPATADGSLSSDVDGDALAFTVDWGDGTPASQDDDGIAQHGYSAPGTVTVALHVEDLGGLAADVQAEIVLVGDDDSSCSCDLGCFDDAVCTQRGCLLFRSSKSGDGAPDAAFSDRLDCP